MLARLQTELARALKSFQHKETASRGIGKEDMKDLSENSS